MNKPPNRSLLGPLLYFPTYFPLAYQFYQNSSDENKIHIYINYIIIMELIKHSYQILINNVLEIIKEAQSKTMKTWWLYPHKQKLSLLPSQATLARKINHQTRPQEKAYKENPV